VEHLLVLRKLPASPTIATLSAMEELAVAGHEVQGGHYPDRGWVGMAEPAARKICAMM